MRKQRIRRTAMIILLLVSSYFPHVVKAQSSSCTTCSSAPNELQNYFRVMDQLLAQIEITPDYDQTTGGVIADVGQATRSAMDVAATTTLLSTVVGAQTFRDVFSDMKTFYRSDSMRRERQTLTDYDLKIAKRIMDMTAAERHNDQVSEETLQRFDSILQRLGYVQLAKDDQGNYALYLREATYTELADILWKLNHFYKVLHRKNYYRNMLKDLGTNYWKTDDLEGEEAIKNPEDEQIERYMHEVIDLKNRIFKFCRFQTPQSEECSPVVTLDFGVGAEHEKMKELFTHIWKIQDGYECSTGLRNQCHARAEIKEDAKELFAERAVQDVKYSINTFWDAAKRLKSALFGPSVADEEAFNQRKEQLVNSYWGTENRREEGEGLFKINSTVEEAPQTVKSLYKGLLQQQKREEIDVTVDGNGLTNSVEPNTDKQPQDHPNPQKYDSEQAKQERLEAIISGARAREQYKRDQSIIDQRSVIGSNETRQKIAAIQSRFVGVLQMQDQLQVESVFTDTNRVTHQFPQLSAAIYKNMEIIGKKNTAGQLYHAIGNVCELQCTNLNGRCWYYTD